jgi:hypothetical protein
MTLPLVPPQREARQGARRLLGRHTGVRLVQATFRDGFFPYTAVSTKECFEQLKREVELDPVLTHYAELSTAGGSSSGLGDGNALR